MANSFATLWSEVDAMRAKSEAEYKNTQAAVRKFEGWRLARVAEGQVWVARHSDSGREIRARSGTELVAAMFADGCPLKAKRKKRSAR